MKLLSVCLLGLSFFGCHSQTNNPVSARDPKHTIIADTNALSHFFEALDALKADSCKTLSIVHIGDSHIQADYFSGMLRVLLQEKFGNAGRGLIFPYAVAHTNEPVNYSSSSTGEWKGVRSVINPDGVEVGISGVSMHSRSTQADFRIRTKNQKGMSYVFNRVELFSKAANPGNTQLSGAQSINVSAHKETPFLSVFDLPDTTAVMTMKFSAERAVDIHGLVLKNGSGGILYHSIGVNGATFGSYNSASLFMEHLPCLKPDLIIISLGTNESYAYKPDTTAFQEQVKLFMEKIRLAGNNSSILFTTPSDNCKLKKGKPVVNPYPQVIGNYLKFYAKQKGYAVWDLYQVMGGAGAMKQWKTQGLATGDYVHFTRKGYEFQGSLLFEALMNYYYTIK